MAELNGDQQIVLEYLKKPASSEGSLLIAVYSLVILTAEKNMSAKLAYSQLTSKQEAEVLQAFAEWGLSQND